MPQPGKTPTHESLTAFLSDKVAKWWLPDDTIVVDALPIGATGKILKTRLRELYGDHKLPTA